MRKTQKIAGFSLIELMVVIAIVAILAGIALPSYRNYVLKSTLRTAQADVVALSLSIENAYQRTLSYPSHNPAIATAAITAAYTSWRPASKSTEMSFSLLSGSAITDLSGNTVSGYVISATPVSSEISNCVIKLDNGNVRQMGASNNCSFASSNSW